MHCFQRTEEDKYEWNRVSKGKGRREQSQEDRKGLLSPMVRSLDFILSRVGN